MAEIDILSADDQGAIHLPQGVAVGDLALTRHGMDLGLSDANGHDFRIEGYFSAQTQPDITGEGGSRLTPELVQSFVRSEARFAANEQMTDESPVGHVSEVSGNATVIHADGTSEKISSGTPIRQGDVIETDASGAVNITFSDESSFAVSENARLAIDDYSFNPETESGSTGVSVLKGVFMFTSGLVGRENPDNVHIETPVGSIGIRGTIIGGKIAAGAAESQITVIEGAIVVKNGTGEQVLSSQFETVKLTSFNAPISNIGVLEAKTVTQSYEAVRGVSSTLFSSIDDAAGDTNGTQGRDAAPGNNNTDAPADSDSRSDAAPDNTDGNGDAAQAQAAPAEGEAQTQGAQAEGDAASADAAADDSAQAQASASSAAADPVIALSADVAAPAAAAPAPVAVAAASTVAVATTVTASTAAAPASAATQVSTATQHIKAPAPATTPVVTEQPAPSAVTFKSGGYVLENTAQGHVVGQVGVQDVLNGKVAYTITNDPANLFTINAKTGEVRLKAQAGDFETQEDYHITVRATRNDNGKYSDTDLTIDLRDVNEAPSFSGTGSHHVNEGASYTLLFSKVGATDPENENLTYSVKSVTHGKIQVDGVDAASFTQNQLKAGLVTFVHDGNEPDSNTGFALQAADGAGNQTAVRNFHVDVTGVNDAPAITSGQNNLNIQESNASPISSAVLNVQDPDNTDTAGLVYTITGATNGHVQTRDISGNWSDATTFTQADVDHGNVRFLHDGDQTGNSADFTVTVSDGALTSASHTVSFLVQSVNDPATGVTLVGDNHYVAETASSNSTLPIQSFKVNDRDTDPALRQYTFSITNKTSGAVDDRFDVFFDEVRDQYDLVLKAGASLNFEEASKITLTIAVKNASTGEMETAQDIDVNIVNVMDSVTINGDAMNATHGLRIYNDVLNPNYVETSPGFGMQARFADIDGDGKADVVIGSPLAQNEGVSHVGTVHNILNNPGAQGELFASSGSQRSTGNELPAMMGISIANIGHFTGDNADDVAMAIPGRGEVRIYNGASGNYITINNIPTPSDPEDLARSIRVMGIGDFDGDGYDDLLVSARYATADGSDGAGRVAIFSGRDFTGTTTTLSFTSGYQLSGTQTNERFGAAAVGLGHVYGEPGDAFAVSAPYYDSGTSFTDRGMIRVYSSESSDYFAIKGAANAQLGTQLAASDVNGDGLKDIIAVSAAENSGRGMGYVFFTNRDWQGNDYAETSTLNQSGSKLTGFRISSNTETIGNIANAGDFNGDGYEDFLVNAYTVNGQVYNHSVYVVYGKMDQGDIALGSLTAAQGLKISIPDSMRLTAEEAATNQNLSLSLDGGADYNGDGYDDIIIGTPTANDDSDPGREGGALIIYGGNYDGRTIAVTGTTPYATGTYGSSLVGDAENNTIKTTYSNTSMRGGGGNDTFIVEGSSHQTYIRMIDGGAGHDRLQLIDMDSATDQADIIDLRGISQKLSSIEEISLDSSKSHSGGMDSYFLTIGDIISMLDDVGTLKITTNNENTRLYLKQDNLVDNLSSVGDFLIGHGGSGFTNDANGDEQADTKNEGGKEFYVYTHQETGHELLVQTSIANAGNLGGVV